MLVYSFYFLRGRLTWMENFMKHVKKENRNFNGFHYLLGITVLTLWYHQYINNNQTEYKSMYICLSREGLIVFVILFSYLLISIFSLFENRKALIKDNLHTVNVEWFCEVVQFMLMVLGSFVVSEDFKLCKWNIWGNTRLCMFSRVLALWDYVSIYLNAFIKHKF